MSWELDFVIENAKRPGATNGIRRLAGTLRPGVVKLRGRNGACKTTAQYLLARLGAEKWLPSDVELADPRTGSTARIQIDGATLIYHPGSAPVASGLDKLPVGVQTLPASYLTLDTGAHRKSEAAALRARLEAVCSIAGVVPTLDRLELVAKGMIEIDPEAVGTRQYPDWVDKIGDLLHEQKRQRQRQAEAQESEAEGLAKVVGARLEEAGMTIEQLTQTDSREKLDAARDRMRSLLDKRAWARQEAARREELRASLGERPADPAAAASKAAEIEAKIVATESMLASLRADLTRYRTEASTAEKRLKEWEATQKLVADVPQDVPEEEVQRAMTEVSRLERQVAQERASAEVYPRVTERDDLLQRAAKLAEEAKEYEEAAQTVWLRAAGDISDALSSDNLRVRMLESGPSVEVTVDGKWRDVTEVSEGERLAATIRTLAERTAGKIILVEDNTPIDEKRQQEIALLAKGIDLCLVLEEWDESVAEVELVEVEAVF